MLFESLRVTNVRNITDIHIEPDAHLNLVLGPNASGKTALLEAMHILARGKSFRTPRIKDVIKHSKDSLQIVANLKNNSSASISTGIEKSHGSTLIKYNGNPVKTVSSQASNIPLVVVTPDSHILVTGSPKYRRHWLDWAMFHVEPTYLQDWRAYQKALRNRNILLKQGCSKQEISSWESSMVITADVLSSHRQKFIKKLQEQVILVVKDGFPSVPEISFKNGDAEGVELTEYLDKEREKDRVLGYTRYGPHKADISFLTEGHRLSQVYSRGQIKKFVTFVLLAQAKTYELINKEKAVFLIDDYAAELDNFAREEMLSLLELYGSQVFLTSTEESEVLPIEKTMNVFHVERGNFQKVEK